MALSKAELNKKRTQYSKEHYEHIKIVVPIGSKDKLKEYSAREKLSVSAYIMKAVACYEYYITHIREKESKNRKSVFIDPNSENDF